MPASTASYHLTITDNDYAVYFLTESLRVVEGAEVSLGVSISSASTLSTGAITVPITHGGTVDATDFSLPNSPVVVFGVGELRKDFVVTLVADAVVEDNETLILGFGATPRGITWHAFYEHAGDS